MRRGRVGRMLAPTLAVLAVGLPALVLGGDPVPESTRVLLLGDSVTQGSSGDWTWRYRLWQHLSASGVDVDLVGPRDDLLDADTATFGSQEYVDPDFDRDHAARWGMRLADVQPLAGELAGKHRPEVVVELLGINDLVWAGASPSEVEDGLSDLVTDVRAVDPGVDVVLGELPQVWFEGVSELNSLLADLAERLDTDSSRVVTAATGRGFLEGVDTYDPAHLSATGEVKVAAAVADALAELGIGSPYPRPLPQVPNGPRQPALLTVQPGDGSADLSWRSPPGASAEFIWVRDRSTGEPWARLPLPVSDDTWTAGGLVNGHDYEFRLQSAKGTAVAEDVFSNVVGVRPGPQVVPPFPVPLPAPPPPGP
jgi:lysophospholipase L1-like esterase